MAPPNQRKLTFRFPVSLTGWNGDGGETSQAHLIEQVPDTGWRCVVSKVYQRFASIDVFWFAVVTLPPR